MDALFIVVTLLCKLILFVIEKVLEKKEKEKSTFLLSYTEKGFVIYFTC